MSGAPFRPFWAGSLNLLPGIGSAAGFGGKRTDTETFYAYTSFTTPSAIYRYDLAAGKSTIFKQPKVDFRPDDFQTEQVFYPSKDGTQIPMYIIHKKGIKMDGNNPCFLYAYGGFNLSILPAFSPSAALFLETSYPVKTPDALVR